MPSDEKGELIHTLSLKNLILRALRIKHYAFWNYCIDGYP